MGAVKINFDNPYTIDELSDDLRNAFFTTELRDGANRVLKVEIDNESHDLLPDVYNIAFGPLNGKGEIDDKAQLTHRDYSKVFSTILLTAYTYLTANPQHYLGIDGSENNRAILYYWMLQVNFDYLDQYFEMFGLKYYVRITRFAKTQYDDPFDFKDILAKPDRITKGLEIDRKMMYNYFIFSLKPQAGQIPLAAPPPVVE